MDTFHEIEQVLHTTLEGGGVRRLVISQPGATPPPGTEIMPMCRLNIVASGTLRTLYGRDRKTAEATLPERSALFCQPHGWNCTLFPATAAVLGLVFRPKFTRFFLSRHRLYVERPEAPDVDYLTYGPLIGTGQELLDILCRLGSNEANPQTALHVVNALLTTSLDTLRSQPPTKRVSSALLTYGRIIGYVRDNYTRPITRDGIAAVVGVHPNHVSRIFNRHSDHTLVQHIQSLRTKHAARLLSSSSLPVADVAVHSGFTDLCYFFRVFRKHFAMTPAEYRRHTRASPHPKRQALYEAP